MSSSLAYRDSRRPVTERVEDLLLRMSLAEKIAQMGSHWVYELLDGTAFSVEKAKSLMRDGIGQIARVGGASNFCPAESAALSNAVQRYLVENTRLGIPAIIHEECCSGYMARGATVFPQAIGVASTWEPALVREMADVIRSQMRSVGAHQALGPLLDVTRDARWGRVEETFGEDPYLVASLGTSYIEGLQGDELRSGVVATAKHLVGYGMSEGGMNWAPPHLGWRELREVYLYPFEAAVREAKLASVMNGYHEIDGVPCSSSKELLTRILREEWGFDGTVVSDYFSINTLVDCHHVACSKADAASMALEAGIDVELPFTDCFGDPLQEAMLQGKLAEALVDTAVRWILSQKFRLGLFDNPYVNTTAVALDTPQDRRLARAIAQKSIVLLKNDGALLPLSREVDSIAVIGPNADTVRNLFGDYTYPAHIETLLELQDRDNVFHQPLPEVLGVADDFIQSISILGAIKAKVRSAVRIHYGKGCDVLDGSIEGFAEAVEAARQAQIAIVVVGDKAGLTDDCTSGEARDRAALDLPGIQGQLVRAVYDTGTPVVLVLVNGRPVTLGWMAESIPAIVEAWFPGEEGASAIADVLFGDVNPGGKLPITFPRSAGQVPIFYGHRPSGGQSYWKVDYVETSVKPLYPFGHGLSYTRFEFGKLRIDSSAARVDGEVTVQVDVSNVGERSGDEVVQLYTRQQVPRVTRPVKELKAFRRVTVAPHDTQTVFFRLPVNQFGFYDADLNYAVEPGQVEVLVGASSENISCSGSFEILGLRQVVGERKAFFSESTLA